MTTENPEVPCVSYLLTSAGSEGVLSLSAQSIGDNWVQKVPAGYFFPLYGGLPARLDKLIFRDKSGVKGLYRELPA